MLDKHTKTTDYCWLSFQSLQVWKLKNADKLLMIERFTGRETTPQMTWSKVIWNNKYLWYTGYHAGGACTAQSHDWSLIVYDWREQIGLQIIYFCFFFFFFSVFIERERESI